MNKKYCDWCGVETDNNPVCVEGLPELDRCYLGPPSFDLCDECMNKLTNFIRNNGEVKKRR
jgi:hypothetical protein